MTQEDTDIEWFVFLFNRNEQIKSEVENPQSHILSVMRRLTQRVLVEQKGDDYRITEEGRGFLSVAHVMSE